MYSSQAVCSFKPEQLKCSSSRTVRFFHGLSGLENALDDESIPTGQPVLFNGASLLLEKCAQPSSVSQESDWMTLIDNVNFNKYQALCGAFRFLGKNAFLFLQKCLQLMQHKPPFHLVFLDISRAV